MGRVDGKVFQAALGRAALLVAALAASSRADFPAVAPPEEEIPPVVVTDAGKVRFQWFDPFAEEVAVAGSFNDWKPAPLRLTRPEMLWVRDEDLKPGTYEYKFLFEGEWEGGANRRFRLIRGKGGRLEVAPEFPAFNTPYNSRVFFSGRAFGKAAFVEVPDDAPADAGRRRFAPIEYDFSLRTRFTAGERISGYAEADVNREEDRFQTLFDEGGVSYQGGTWEARLFHRQRVADLDDPMRLLDPFLDTLDDGVYLTKEKRPPVYGFGREFDRLRFNSGDNTIDFTFSGWQGISLDWGKGPYDVLFVGADHLLRSDDLWLLRATRTGELLEVGSTVLLHNRARGLVAAPAGENSSVQTTPFADNDGGVFRYPPGNAGNDARDFPYDVLYFFEPNGANRDLWYAFDARVGPAWGKLFLELAKHKKDWSFVAYEDGDGLNPNGGAHTSAENLGEFLVGGVGTTNSVMFGGQFFPNERWAFEASLRFDDGTERTIDAQGNLVDVNPENTIGTVRLKYTGARFLYGGEVVRRDAKEFANTVLTAAFDDFNFQDVEVTGAADLLEVKQIVAFNPNRRFALDLGHRFRRYDLFGSTLETNELRGRIGRRLSRRLRAYLAGRLKLYDFPQSAAVTDQPGRSFSFFYPSLRFVYDLSPWVTISFGYGLDFRNDEDLEEGRLFFLREALTRARRPGGSSTHTLDQILEAERALRHDHRVEFQFDVRF